MYYGRVHRGDRTRVKTFEVTQRSIVSCCRPPLSRPCITTTRLTSFFFLFRRFVDFFWRAGWYHPTPRKRSHFPVLDEKGNVTVEILQCFEYDGGSEAVLDGLVVFVLFGDGGVVERLSGQRGRLRMGGKGGGENVRVDR